MTRSAAGTLNPKARDAYNVWHGHFEISNDANSPWHRLLRSHLRIPQDLAGKHVLEIGCGRGDFACWLARQTNGSVGRMVAADFSVTAVNKGRAFALAHGLKLEWEVMDIQSIGHPDRAFDLIFSCETIEHVSDPRQAIAELARILRPGGRLFLTTPNYLGTMGLYRGYLRLTGRRYSETGQPINNFVLLPRTRAWLQAAGLKILRTDAIGHYLPFPGRPPIELPWLESPRWLMRWLGLHSLVIAEHPAH